MSLLETYFNQFWTLRRSKRITNLQADLYFFLLSESKRQGNGNNWENPFQCANGLVCTSIGITEKSLIDARNVLQQLGLIEYQKGITKKQSPTYYLPDYCNKVSIPVGNQGGNQGGNAVSNPVYINSSIALVAKEAVEAMRAAFLSDEALVNRWLAQGYEETYPNGLDYFFSRNQSKTYPNYDALRTHFWNWIPKFRYELNDRKRNGNGNGNGAAKTSNGHTTGIGRSAISPLLKNAYEHGN